MKHHSLFLSILCVGSAMAAYEDNAQSAIDILQDKWYDTATGLWDNKWWQSANMLETIARFGLHDESFKPAAIDIIENTYAKSGNQKGYTNWHNGYYDDMGWWAMAFIKSYDLTGDAKYLITAADLFEDMTSGWTTPCNGGIWWNKAQDYISAISNELFLNVAAHLANRAPASQKPHFVAWAQAEWDWFWSSGIINAQGTINDDIDQQSCSNSGKTTWTYNQGVVLAGLSELARATADGGPIAHANDIASAAIQHLSDDTGILTEPVGGALDDQASQFKGAFVRGLAVLNANEPQDAYRDFLRRNADSAWDRDRVGGGDGESGEEGAMADKWQGGSGNVNVASHASGIDVLVAAAEAG